MIRRTFLSFLFLVAPVMAGLAKRPFIFIRPKGRFYELRCDERGYTRQFLIAYQDWLWPGWEFSEQSCHVHQSLDLLMQDYDRTGGVVCVDVGTQWLRQRFWSAAQNFNVHLVGETEA